MKKLNIIAGKDTLPKSLYPGKPIKFKDSPGSAAVTKEVIDYLGKDREAMEYIREDTRMNSGEDFMFAFENYLKDEWKDSSYKWDKINWDKVAKYFLEG